MPEAKPKNVVEALNAVMAELGPIGKDSKAAKEQGGYAYRGIEAITREAQPLFAKHGIVMVPQVSHHEVREITVNNKPWTDTILYVSYTVYGPGGTQDCITLSTVGIGRDNSDKGANKAMTQAYKYALIQTLCISDAKDDGDHGSPEADERPAPVVVDPLKVKRAELSQAAKDALLLPERAAALLAEWFGEGTKSTDLDLAQLDTAILGFKREGAKAPEQVAFEAELKEGAPA